MRLWVAATNDDFSDPPGMDARRARSDRDVARARGQKNRVSKGLRATKREAGRLCAPAQSAFPPSMAVRSKRPTGVRGKTPQRGHRAGRQPKKPARAAATTQNIRPSKTNPNVCRNSRVYPQAAGTTTQSVVASQRFPTLTKTAAEAAVLYPLRRQARIRRA